MAHNSFWFQNFLRTIFLHCVYPSLQYKYIMRITAFETDQIPFNNLTSVLPIRGIALTESTLKDYSSNALLFDTWGVTGNYTQITAVVEVLRQSRIVDRTVQLYDGQRLILNNAATTSTENIQTYVFTGEFVVADTFGIVLDYDPHPTTPSSTTVIIRRVQLTFA